MTRSTYRPEGDEVWRCEDGEPVERILDFAGTEAASALQAAYNRGDSDGYAERAQMEWDDNSWLPVDADHAFLVGTLAGSIMGPRESYEVRNLDDEAGNHLAVFEVVAHSGLYRVRVEKMR